MPLEAISNDSKSQIYNSQSPLKIMIPEIWSTIVDFVGCFII